ncbi:MAG: hypothetical protein R2941_22370 [Desulfobacterales bacterium]
MRARNIRNGKHNLGGIISQKRANRGCHALVWAALLLIPDDPDLRFNYEYALTLIKDDRGEKNISIVRILFSPEYLLGFPGCAPGDCAERFLFWIW